MLVLVSALMLVAPASSVAAGSEPVLFGNPSLSPTGKLSRGQTLTVAPGTWAPTPASYSYAWFRCSAVAQCAPIAGATAQTYTLTTDDVGSHIRAEETAYDGAGGANQPASTGYVFNVLFGPPVPVAGSLPTITATGNSSGATLTASSAQWQGLSGVVGSASKFSWLRCDQNGDNCVAFQDQTASVRIQPNDVGSTFRVEEVARNDSGESAPLRSAATSPAVLPDVPSPAQGAAPGGGGILHLSGYGTTAAPRPGLTLLVSGHGNWISGTPDGRQFPILDYVYQWTRCDQSGGICTPISGATGQSYTIAEADIGFYIAFEERAINAGGIALRAQRAFQNAMPGPSGRDISTKVVAVNAAADGGLYIPKAISKPVVNGDAVVGATLTLTHGTWDATPQSYRIQWSRCTDIKDQHSCKGMVGANGSTYTVTKKDFGQSIRAFEVPLVNGEPISQGQLSDFTDVVRTSIGNVLATGPITTYAAPKAGTVTVTWTAKAKGRLVVVAEGKGSSTGIQQLSVDLKLTPAGRTLLRKAKKAKRAVNVTATMSFKPKPGKTKLAIDKFRLDP